MSCCLRFFLVALWGICDAIAQPGIDLAVTPVWSGWSRTGRATEINIRVRTAVATRASVDIVAGSQSVRAELDLQAGQVARLHIPVAAVESLAVTARSRVTTPERRDVAIAQSESPLLGLGVTMDDSVNLEGFHTVTLSADDLPRNASAYSSIDALILDAPTLGALDHRQLEALLAHTAACGRTALVNADPRSRRLLEEGAGCGGRSLMSAASLPDAMQMIRASLAVPMAPGISLASLADLARSDYSTWQRVLVILAAYFGAALLVASFTSSMLVFLLLPALATALVWAGLHVVQPTSRLLIWSEADSGARVAQYHAWQSIVGGARTGTLLSLLPRLGPVRPCDAGQPMRFYFDATRGLATSAEFDTRLFRPVSLCYSGSFPIVRVIGIEVRPDGALDVRNAGTLAWPKGVLLSGRLVHDLPALAPGEVTRISSRTGKPPADPAARAALSRTPPNGQAALWPLDARGVAEAPADSAAWLLVSIPPP